MNARQSLSDVPQHSEVGNRLLGSYHSALTSAQARFTSPSYLNAFVRALIRSIFVRHNTRSEVSGELEPRLYLRAAFHLRYDIFIGRISLIFLLSSITAARRESFSFIARLIGRNGRIMKLVFASVHSKEKEENEEKNENAIKERSMIKPLCD